MRVEEIDVDNVEVWHIDEIVSTVVADDTRALIKAEFCTNVDAGYKFNPSQRVGTLLDLRQGDAEGDSFHQRYSAKILQEARCNNGIGL